MTAKAQRRVAVVGAGVSGLVAAYRLQQAGHEVEVFESREQPGGVLGTLSIDGGLRETAANGFLDGAPDGAASLAEELGVPTTTASPQAKKRWIYLDDRLCEAPGGIGSLVTTPILSPLGKLRAAIEPLVRGGAGPDESIDDFARRRFGKEVADRVIAPIVTGIYAGDTRVLGLHDAFPRVADWVGEHGVVRGLLQRRGKQGAGRRAAQTKAPLAGMGAIVGALADRLPGLHLRSPVQALSYQRSKLMISSTLGTREFDAGVLAVPAPQAAYLVDDLESELPARLREFPFAGVCVVHLCFHRTQVHHPLDGFGFLVPRGEPLSLLGCVFESVVWPNRAPPGQVMVRCMVGGTRDPNALEQTDEALVARCTQDLDRALGVTGHASSASVVRWANGIPQYHAGHQQRVKRVEQLAACHGLALTGSSYHGVAVNDCVADGRRTVGRINSLMDIAILLAMIVAGIGCSGSSPTTRPPSEDADPAPSAEKSTAPVTGTLEVEVRWLSPPANLVVAPSVGNACGVASREALSVHSAGGVRGAVVVFHGAARTPDGATELAVESCRVAPRTSVVNVGARGVVRNRDERGHDLLVTGPRGQTRAALRILGGERSIHFEHAGVYRISLGGAETDDAAVFATANSEGTVTDHRGIARFGGVPTGAGKVTVWHPGPFDGKPVEKHVSVAITADTANRLVVELAP